ncbi:MAG: hypothetical protein Q4D29_09195 [Lachnospiraceae bacterium]|nr:hypothetical protein [Lachnospiraceae bacterium]
MKLLSKLTIILSASVACLILFATPVKAANGMPSREELFLKKQMENQQTFNAKTKEYIELQNLRAKAEKRPVSDIEMVKRQALEGMVTGNNNLLDMGAINLASGQASGEYNIAFMDQQAYEGFVSGMAELERVKRDTWMQYTFRTH